VGPSHSLNPERVIEMEIKLADKESYFKPWIGKKWNHRDNSVKGLKVLILSESHYTHEPKLIGQSDPETTKWCVQTLGIDTKHHHFTKILQTVTGRPRWEMTQDDIKNFWESVVYYNYVPVYVSVGSGVSPTEEMFKLGAKPFRELVSKIDPELILVFGHRVWPWMLYGWSGNNSYKRLDRVKISRAVTIKLPHPSSRGFSWRKANQILFMIQPPTTN
jgi:hypothetical protein